MREGIRPSTLILVKHAWWLGLPALVVTDAPGLTEPFVVEQIS